MLYDYKCKECNQYYTKTNTMDNRNEGGRCPKCTSDNTVKVMSTPAFKTCGGGHPGNPVK